MTSSLLRRQTQQSTSMQPFPYVRAYWGTSKWFRRVLIGAVIFTIVRLLMQFLLLSWVFEPSIDLNLVLPDDLRIYLDASADVQAQAPLYPDLPLERMEFYQYAPSFALAFTPFRWLPTGITVLLHTFLHVAVYALLYVWWGRIFQRFGLENALKTLAWLLPVWLLFSAFWSDLGYLNVYILMALLATLLIDAVMRENLATSALWATVILQIKPQWAFVLLVPLLLKQWRFFVKLLASTAVAYSGVSLVTVVIVGASYGLSQYAEYFNLLLGIGGNYPWRTPDMPFLGYNHSIAQTVIYLFGNTTDILRLSMLVKGLILLPLVITAVRYLRRPLAQPSAHVQLVWAFTLYTAAFIWLDVVWELSLGIAVFTYLLATTSRRRWRIVLWIVFLPYALIDAIQVLSYLMFGDAVVVPGPYVLTDPSIYVPLIMIVTVVFYGILIGRLWSISTSPSTDPRIAD